MLEIKNIEVVYNEVVLVIKGLSLIVKEGEIVSLLGANGAGKSTTLKAISGLLKTEDGEIKYDEDEPPRKRRKYTLYSDSDEDEA